MENEENKIKTEDYTKHIQDLNNLLKMSLKNEAEVSDFVEHLKIEVDKFKDDI